MSFWVAGATVVAGVGGAIISSNAASKASKAQQKGIDQATAEQARQYDQTRADLAPWREVGTGAVNRLAAASTGDMSSFQASPDYNFVRSEGQRNMGNSFAARGGAFSGNALRALDQFNQNLASGEYGNWWNRQAQLSGLGQSATNSTAQAGMNAANNISDNYLMSGNARASGIAAQGNIWGGLVNNLANFGTYKLLGGMGSTSKAPVGYNGNYAGGLVQW